MTFRKSLTGVLIGMFAGVCFYYGMHDALQSGEFEDTGPWTAYLFEGSIFVSAIVTILAIAVLTLIGFLRRRRH